MAAKTLLLAAYHMAASSLHERSPPCIGQVMGMVGSARKRMLMLWQAVEMSRAMDKPDQATLALARRALEPPADPTDIDAIDADLVSRQPLASGVPRHWSIVRCGCIEGAAPSVL